MWQLASNSTVSEPEHVKLIAYSLKTYFGGSRSFKVIDVGTLGKLISSACCDAQQVYSNSAVYNI